MSRRMEIELTSARSDGTWTWRAAGAQKPKGVMNGALLPEGAKAGDVVKADVETGIDGVDVLAILSGGRTRKEPTLIEITGSSRPFEAVTQTLAPGRGRDGDRKRSERGDRDRPRRDGDRPGRDAGRPPRDGARPPRDGARPAGAGDRGPRGPRPEGGFGDRGPRGPRPEGGTGERGPRGPRPDGERREFRDRPSRPRFEPVPEMPQRPKAKRLKPGRTHRNAVLSALSESERAIAEKALLGGIPAVRTAVTEQNAALRAAGQQEIPAAGLLKIAEELLPRLRVAEWLDRADAAKADVDELDLKDLRSVVASGEDPMVARDEATRGLAAELKEALATRQERALTEWQDDISTAVGVGRVIRALKLSSEPPKAGVRFPAELGQRLVEATNASLTPDALSDRWSAVLEAAAFSPIRAQITASALPTTVTDDLRKAVTRLAPLIPSIAALFGIEVAEGAVAPKPLRQPRRPEGTGRKPAPGAAPSAPGQSPRKPPAPPVAPVATAAAATEPKVVVETADVVKTPAVTDVVETAQAVETPAVTDVVEAAQAVETPTVVEVAEAAEVVETSNAPESVATPDVVESVEAVEVAATPEPTETSEVDAAAEVAEIIETPVVETAVAETGIADEAEG